MERRINIIGWIYFCISLVGSVILLANVEQKIYLPTRSLDDLINSPTTITNYTNLALGLAGLVQAFLVLFVCQSLSYLISQNEFIESKIISLSKSFNAQEPELQKDEMIQIEDEKIYCPNCGWSNSPDYESCRKCGTKLHIT